MSTFITARSLAAAAFIAAAGFSLFSINTSAEAATGSRQCQTDSFQKTKNCCDGLIRKSSSHYVLGVNNSCHAAVACRIFSPNTYAGSGGGKRTLCYIAWRKLRHDDDTHDHRPPDHPSHDNPNGGHTPGAAG
jgi:hypothetical protein